MRIAILQGAFFPVPPILGGAVEKMWFSLGKEFARQGHEVVQISRLVDGLPSSEMQDGVSHVRVDGFDTPKSGLILKLFDLLYTLRTRRLFSSDFDVIISNTFWAPIVLPKIARRVCMVDVQRMPKKQMKLYRKAARLRANSSAVVMAIQEELPEYLYDKVIMIPNPLPFVPLQVVDETSKKTIILYVGRVHPEKGLDLLIKAFKRTNQSYRLQVVGPWDVAAGGGGDSYINSLRQLAGDASIEFLGPVYDMDVLNEYYKNASIFVYPSVAEKGETFGLAPLEAMAWGCVPIVSNLACFQDFIVHKENGLIFDHRAQDAVEQLADHISLVQQDNDYRKQLSENAVHVRQTHSIAHIANLFLEEFAHIVNQSAKHNDSEFSHV